MAGDELAILTAFANTDIPVDQAVMEIAEVNDALKHVLGYGAVASEAKECSRSTQRLPPWMLPFFGKTGSYFCGSQSSGC